MDGYIIALKPWGLYVQVGRTMRRERTANFLHELEAGYRFIQRERGGWVSVYDVRELDLDTVRFQDVEAIGHLARQMNGGRVAVIVGDLRGAAVLAESNRACGLEDRCRVIPANAGHQGGVKAAYAWALEGVEPVLPGAESRPDRTAWSTGSDQGWTIAWQPRYGVLQDASWT